MLVFEGAVWLARVRHQWMELCGGVDLLLTTRLGDTVVCVRLGGGGGGGCPFASMISGINMFRCVCRGCMRVVDWRTCGYIGLLNGVNQVATLKDCVASTLGGVTPSTLYGSALSTLGDVATSSLCW